MLGVYTTSRANGRGNSPAFLPLSEISSISDTIVNKLKTQNPQDVFPPGTDSTIIAGWKAQRDLLVKYTKQNKIANIEIIGGPLVTTVGLVLAKPFSRGFLTLKSADPFDDPAADFGTFRNPLDIDLFVELIGYWRRLLGTNAAQILGPAPVSPPNNLTSTADLADFLRRTVTSSVYHPGGSAAMLKKELGGVVNSELLVYGTKKLSVVDASIIPIVPSAHTQAITYAIAEKVRNPRY